MAKFAVQGKAAEMIYVALGKGPTDLSDGQNLVISLQSGVIAGVAAATISHPADTLLSKINKKGSYLVVKFRLQADFTIFYKNVNAFRPQTGPSSGKILKKEQFKAYFLKTCN